MGCSQTKKCLVVDDNKGNRFIIKKYLQKFGYEVIEVTNGREAIRMVQKDKKYSIIWMDVHMPSMNGIECVRKLRKLHNYKGPIIGITGNVHLDTLVACKEAGMDEIVVKPYNKQKIMFCIKKYS